MEIISSSAPTFGAVNCVGGTTLGFEADGVSLSNQPLHLRIHLLQLHLKLLLHMSHLHILG